VPTLLFLLPILDTTLVTFTRLLRGQSPAQGGRDHTSHRLIAFGLNERQAVLALYAIALVSGIMAAVLESIAYWYSLVIVPLVVLSLALLTAYLGGLKVVISPPNRGKAFTRIIMELTYRRRLLEVILDFFLIAIAYYLAFMTRFSFIMSPTNLEIYLRTVPIVWVSAYLVFYTFGVYRGVWRYTGMNELLRYLKATLGTVVLVTATILLLYPSIEYSPVVFVLFAIYLFFMIAASRSSFRILDQISGRQVKAVGERVLICGAGDTGEMALRWILMNNQLGYNPVGILDDNPFLTGRQIHGIEVLGDLNQLERIIKDQNIAGVILAVENNGNGELLNLVIPVCNQAGVWLRSLRLEFELVRDNRMETSYDLKN
jgi:UDP-GlcNAc:undecaprenyl-phosphate GlcNAc-1-phosphate transferase